MVILTWHYQGNEFGHLRPLDAKDKLKRKKIISKTELGDGVKSIND